MLSVLLHIAYVIVCVFLILVVLLQTGKRADLAGAFGGGGSQTAFGARGAATLLTKVTTASAVGFMIIALALSILTSREKVGGGTVLDELPATAGVELPVEPPVELGSEPAAIDDPAEATADPLIDEPATPEAGSETEGTDADATGEDSQP